VLFLFVRAAGVLAGNPRAAGIQLTGNIFQITRLKTNWVGTLASSPNRMPDTGSTPDLNEYLVIGPHRSTFTRSTGALDLDSVLLQWQWKEPL